MFIITHALSPVIVAAVADALARETSGTRLFRRPQYVAFAASGALPDLLSPHITLAERFASWSHTAWALALFVPVALLVARRMNGDRFVLLGLLMAAAYALHLFCDAISGGLAWLYPFDPDAIVGAALVPYPLWIYLDLACVLVAGGLALWLRRSEKAVSDQ